jgi:hypothetical protein
MPLQITLPTTLYTKEELLVRAAAHYFTIHQNNRKEAIQEGLPLLASLLGEDEDFLRGYFFSRVCRGE